MGDRWQNYIEISGGTKSEVRDVKNALNTLWNDSETMHELIKSIPELNEQRRSNGYLDEGAPYKTQIVILGENEAPPDYDSFGSKTTACPEQNILYISIDELNNLNFKADGTGEATPVGLVRGIGHELAHIADPNNSALGMLHMSHDALVKLLHSDLNNTDDPSLSAEVNAQIYTPAENLKDLDEKYPGFLDVAKAHLDRINNVNLTDFTAGSEELDKIYNSILDKTSPEFFEELSTAIRHQFIWDRTSIIEDNTVHTMDKAMDEINGEDSPDRICHANNSTFIDLPCGPQN